MTTTDHTQYYLARQYEITTIRVPLESGRAYVAHIITSFQSDLTVWPAAAASETFARFE